MRFGRSLRFRVAASFALLGAAVSVLLSFGLYLANQELERRLVAQSLADELADYAELYRENPDSPPLATKTIRSYVRPDGGTEQVPSTLRSFQPGFHEVSLDGRPHYVLVEDRGASRFYLLYNQTQLKRREQQFVAYLLFGVMLMTGASAAVGFWLAGRVISPVSELARRVARLRPEDRPEAQAQDFPADEVGELARAFDSYLERLQAFVDRERAFTGDVSHELRTPLAVINGAAEVLLARQNLQPGPRARVERIARAAREMSEVTEALLVLARESNPTSRRSSRCVVADVVEEVIDSHRHLLEDKPVRLELEIRERSELPVERALLRIVLGNLVRNAFSFTDRGRVRLKLDGTDLVVEDTGPGIEDGGTHRVFDRYHRSENSNGAGIGLSLVKRICDQHGWRVTVETRPGRGTVTQLDFGSSAEPGEPAAHPPACAGSSPYPGPSK